MLLSLLSCSYASDPYARASVWGPPAATTTSQLLDDDEHPTNSFADIVLPYAADPVNQHDCGLPLEPASIPLDQLIAAGKLIDVANIDLSAADDDVWHQWHRERWVYNAAYRLAPCFIFIVNSTQDAVEATMLAMHNGLTMRIKGAGRNFLDWNTCSDRCLLVSLSGPGIREIEIDDQPGIEPSVTFGAGVQNGELYSRAAESGLAVVSGTCAPVGFAGLALGGGLGILICASTDLRWTTFSA